MIYLAFIYHDKAFNNVLRDILPNIPKKRGINSKLVKIMTNIYVMLFVIFTDEILKEYSLKNKKLSRWI